MGFELCPITDDTSQHEQIFLASSALSDVACRQGTENYVRRASAGYGHRECHG